jgi:hypothetical protein
MALARFKKICMDANDPLALGQFWATALDYALEADERPADEREAGLVDLEDDVWRMWFNRVPQEKSVKNRVHLDIYARSLADLETLGATVLPTAEGVRWTVMADPEGGEFCAFLREEHPKRRLHRLAVDCTDPKAVSHWWHDLGPRRGLDRPPPRARRDAAAGEGHQRPLVGHPRRPRGQRVLRAAGSAGVAEASPQLLVALVDRDDRRPCV